MDFNMLKLNTVSKAMESSMVDVKTSGEALWPFNAMPILVLDIRILRDNGSNSSIKVYCYSYISQASRDENKIISIGRLLCPIQTTCPF